VWLVRIEHLRPSAASSPYRAPVAERRLHTSLRKSCSQAFTTRFRLAIEEYRTARGVRSFEGFGAAPASVERILPLAMPVEGGP